MNNIYDDSSSLNFLSIFLDKREIIPCVEKMIKNAKKEIQLEMYLIEGRMGKRITELLDARAKVGINVKIICHPSKDLKRYAVFFRLLKLLKFKGVNIDYDPYDKELFDQKLIEIKGFKLEKFKKHGIKMAHNKVLIVDSQEALIGSMNFASITEYNHELMVKIEGPLVKQIQKTFFYNWEISDGKLNQLLMHNRNQDSKKVVQGNADVKFLISTVGFENAKEIIINEIRSSLISILLEMYLLSDVDIIKELIAAYKRGVKLEIILDPNRSPLELDLGGIPNILAIRMFIKEGIKVRIYNCSENEEMHIKMAIFDLTKVIVGSTNWTWGSFNFNTESCLLIERGKILKEFVSIFYDDLENSEEIINLTFKQRFYCFFLKYLINYF